MKTITALVTAAISLTLASGCASNSSNTAAGNQVAGTNSERVCRDERPTGSNIKVRRCWSREEYEKMVKDTEAEMRNVQNSRTVGGSSE